MRIDTRTRRVPSGIPHLLLSAGVVLTVGIAAPTLEAANCGTEENGFNVGGYSVKRVLPFLGDRCVQVKPAEPKPASPTPETDPSQRPTALSGDPR